VLGVVGLAGCGDDETAGPETSADVEGVQDEEFWNDVDAWVGKKVTVSAEVNKVISGNAFTIAGDEDSDTDELLVVSADVTKVREDSVVKVTGTVKDGFNAKEVGQELDVEEDPGIFTGWEGKNYIQASSIDTSVSQH
jgi:hypothetical protein